MANCADAAIHCWQASSGTQCLECGPATNDRWERLAAVLVLNEWTPPFTAYLRVPLLACPAVSQAGTACFHLMANCADAAIHCWQASSGTHCPNGGGAVGCA